MATQSAVLRSLLPIPAAAEALGISRSTLYGLMDRGELEYVKVGRARRIPAAAIERFVSRNTFGGEANR